MCVNPFIIYFHVLFSCFVYNAAIVIVMCMFYSSLKEIEYSMCLWGGRHLVPLEKYFQVVHVVCSF